MPPAESKWLSPLLGRQGLQRSGRFLGLLRRRADFLLRPTPVCFLQKWCLELPLPRVEGRAVRVRMHSASSSTSFCFLDKLRHEAKPLLQFHRPSVSVRRSGLQMETSPLRADFPKTPQMKRIVLQNIPRHRALSNRRLRALPASRPLL